LDKKEAGITRQNVWLFGCQKQLPNFSSVNNFAKNSKLSVNQNRGEPTLSMRRAGGVDSFEAEALRRYKAGEIDEKTMLKVVALCGPPCRWGIRFSARASLLGT